MELLTDFLGKTINLPAESIQEKLYKKQEDGTFSNEFADNLAHKLVAAGVGCATASAKQQSCDAGAIGAAVGARRVAARPGDRQFAFPLASNAQVAEFDRHRR